MLQQYNIRGRDVGANSFARDREAWPNEFGPTMLHVCAPFGVLPRMQSMKARLLLRDRETRPDGVIIERAVYELPTASPDRPQGLKYRLYCGREGRCIVRYDNEAGKGDHVHYGEAERSYHFVSLEKLLRDFDEDINRLA